MKYEGKRLYQISFPLGGIGTGCIGLGGNGRLKDFEIYNRPNKRSVNGFTGFVIKAEREGRLLDARSLTGQAEKPLMGERPQGVNSGHIGYGFGPTDSTLAGWPHFQEVSFEGKFPMAKLTFQEERFPGRVEMTAFNPLIPMDSEDSSLPAAFFSFELENTQEEETDYTLCCFWGSPFPIGSSRNVYTDGVFPRITISGRDEKDLLKRGDVTIASCGGQGSRQEYWYRGGWQDGVEMFWEDFKRPGGLIDRHYEEAFSPLQKAADTAALAETVRLRPGEKKTVRFLAAWSFPEMYNFWNPEPDRKRTWWKNYYATRFPDSGACALYCMENWDRLEGLTRLFTETLHGSTLPDPVIDAVSANLSVLKSPTVLRLEDGTFYGFEGCLENEGSCEGSCTHVWNYAYALPFLFPDLERSMREADYRYNRHEDGRMSFRLQLPLGREPWDFLPCVDGQMGGVVKTYREWKFSGDDAWLAGIWPEVKKSLEYAWSEKNPNRWDPEQSGVIRGRQHHTLDMELFGPNSWLTGFYLAALKAAGEMAEHLGEAGDARRYREMFQKGKQWADENLFNGSYYGQRADLTDRSLIDGYGEELKDAYWNEEAGEVKYQIGNGCAIDQVVACWHAALCGLGEIFDEGQVKTALRSLYRNNFKRMDEVENFWRNFAVDEEQGLLICTWPEGKKPAIPLTYSTECMTGFEYQAACHMLYAGLKEEGLSIVCVIRERYDGYRRNPWNEIECGSNYARSMASYSLLPVLSGFSWDGVRKGMGFDPMEPENEKVSENAAGGKKEFRSFWSFQRAWGRVRVTEEETEITVLYGELALRELYLPKEKEAEEICLNGKQIPAGQRDGAAVFEELLLRKEDRITVKWRSYGVEKKQ
ncbi:MAG TPA: hypothetical protein H9700_11345 [Candidatus Eisenbergiella intestinipullorum]|nr:hypothetical protein [Candidatus Eisenbergiella intestinipullorum]